MALVNNGVKLSISNRIYPSGVTLSNTLTEFSDHEYFRNTTLTVPKAAADDADRKVTFKAIIDELESQVAVFLGAEFDDAAKTVTYYIDVKALSNNQQLNLTSEFYTNVAEAYVLNIDIYIKTA